MDSILLEGERLKKENLVETCRRVKERNAREKCALKDSLYVYTRLKGDDFQGLIEK